MSCFFSPEFVDVQAQDMVGKVISAGDIPKKAMNFFLVVNDFQAPVTRFCGKKLYLKVDENTNI